MGHFKLWEIIENFFAFLIEKKNFIEKRNNCLLNLILQLENGGKVHGFIKVSSNVVYTHLERFYSSWINNFKVYFPTMIFRPNNLR